MASLTNTFRSEDLNYSSFPPSNQDRALNSNSNITNKPEKVLTQFEINLSKTMELLNNTSPTNNLYGDSSRQHYESSISHRYSRPEIAIHTQLEVENSELRSTIKSLKRENDSLKIDLNMKRSTARGDDGSRSFRGSISDYEEMKIKITTLQSENESLRQELFKVKSDYSNRYESLRKTNDEVLSSFEEKVNSKDIS
jgi:hypothetical protein